jgi:hypothetical protein
MIFIETPTFTRLIVALLDDDEYAKLQAELVKRPDAGDLIKDGGGIRKLRWKRAGTRQERRHTGHLLLAHRGQPAIDARCLSQKREGQPDRQRNCALAQTREGAINHGQDTF